MSESPNDRSNLEALVEARTEQLRATVLDLDRAHDLSIQVLGSALGLKAASLLLHSKHTTAFAMTLARALGISKEEISAIGRGAFLHDVGMIAVPDVILQKPSELTEAEYRIVQQHVRCGYELLTTLPFLSVTSLEIVYSHHERFDGTGYPRRLKGQAIPIGARILAVVDALGALIFDRPYRSPVSLTQAKREIQMWSKRQFDPAVLDVFLKMPDHVWTDLSKEINSRVTHQDYGA